MRLFSTLLAISLICLPIAATAQDGRFEFGGDQFAAGQSASIDTTVAHDAFAAGYDVTLSGPASGDAHLAGYNVRQAADVAGDLYAAGFSVSINGSVGGDITAMGNSVTIAAPQPITGNLRLAGQTVTVSSAINGSALITAQSLTLASTVQGDLGFFGESLSFGPDAKVDGTVTIHAPREITVPASVAAPDRVRFELLVAPDYATEAGKTAEHVVRGIWPAVWATGVWWLLLFVVGVLAIALAPGLTQSLQTIGASRPVRRIGLGVVAFSAVIGLVPVLALTVIGILVVPIALLFVVVACTLAYLTGTYLAGARIVRSLTSIDDRLKRVGVLAISIVVFGLLGTIPFIGWLITLVVLCFGFGAIARIMMGGASSSERPQLAAAAQTPGAI